MKFPEHALQTQIKVFVREAVAVPHLFLAFDRTRKMSDMQHIFEKQRGIKRGTPDTVLLIADFPSIWCELKAGKNKPSGNQFGIGDEIARVHHQWIWANSVHSYGLHLHGLGVPLQPSWPFIAQHRDALLLSAETKLPTKPHAPRKPGSAKPTLAQIRKAEVMRLLP